MILSFIPIFKHGLILKQNMLDALRDYPMNYVDIVYSDRGDGVICGLDIEITDNDSFVVKEGIVKINGRIFLIENSDEICFEEEENFVYLKFRHEEYVDGTEYIADIVQQQEEDNNLFELFRYVKNGQIKRYCTIEDAINGVVNRIDSHNMHKSIVGGSTLPDEFFELFAKKILQSSNSDMKDIAFAYQCLNGIDNVRILKEYFGDNISNENVLQCIKTVVERLQNNIDNQDASKATEVQKRKQVYVE